MIYLPHRRKAFRSSWTPASIANLALWFDAQQETYANNDAVGQWTDRSSNGFHVTATLTARPTFKTGITNGGKTFNGLSFDGNANVLSRDPFTVSSLHGANLKDTTIFIVQKQVGSIDDRASLFFNRSPSRLVIHATYGNAIYFDIGSIASGRVNVAQPVGWDDAWHQLTFLRNVDTQGIRVDGASLVSATRSAANSATTSVLCVGGFDTDLFFGGDMSELIIYAAALSSGDISTVENYLKSRYGIS